LKDSHFDDEKNKYGSDSKAMGGEKHKEVTEGVRKQETAMGNLQNVQLDSAAQPSQN
jgi:hypothetical protein